MTASTDFTELTHLFRGELLAHCYRMLGSVDEAEAWCRKPTCEPGGHWRVRGPVLGPDVARQRAMLILRDVLGWPAAEVAELLGTTTTAVNSGLRRARAQLARTLPAEDETTEPNDPVQRAILDRFTAAFENGDADTLAELLRKDAMLEMPPLPGWFAGQDMIRDFLAA